MALENDKQLPTDNHLRELFEKIVPVVDDVADGLRWLLVISLGTVIWLFCFFFLLKQWGLTTALVISAFAIFPSLLLMRLWFALEDLKRLPEIAEQLIEDVTEDVAQSWHAAKSSKKAAFNAFGQLKKLFQLRSLLSQFDDVLDQYFSIGLLLNPVSWFFGVLALLGVFVQIFISLGLALVALL